MLWICGRSSLDNTPKLWLLLNSACTASRLFLCFPLCPSRPVQVQWVGWGWTRGVGRGHSWPKLTKGMFCDIWRHVRCAESLLSRKGLNIFMPMGSIAWISLFTSLVHAALLPLLSVIILIEKSSHLPSILSPSHQRGEWASVWVSIWLLARANPPHQVLLLESVSEISGHICSRNNSTVWWFITPPPLHASKFYDSVINPIPTVTTLGWGACRNPWINIWNPDITEFWNSISSNIFKAQSYVLLISRKSLIATAGSLSVSWSAWYFWLKMRLITVKVAAICNNKKGKF